MIIMNHLNGFFFLSAFILNVVFTMPDASFSTKNGIFRMKNKNAPIPKGTRGVSIDTSRSLHIISRDFLSLTIDSGQIKANMEGFVFDSKKLQNMAAALSPTNIRFGGTNADFLHFDPNGSESPLGSSSLHTSVDATQAKPITRNTNFTMTGALWDKITTFCNEVGWDLVFDFDLFFWRNGYWDPSNADQLLKYSAERGVRIPSFQLGNEPDLYNRFFDINIPGDVLVKDLHILRRLISQYPQYDASAIYGPEVAFGPTSASQKDYLWKFLKAGGCDVVSEVDFHHYYISGNTAKVKDMVDPAILDSLKVILGATTNLTSTACGYNKPVRLAETSSCYGGGAPGLSDTFVDGFMWMDKLGLSAKYGLTHVFRQTFFGLNYALIDMNLNPNPDFYLSVLYKRLVEGPVFDVSISGDTGSLRVYAHCAHKDYYKLPSGALVLYFMNLDKDAVTFIVDQYQIAGFGLFMLTQGDRDGLVSRSVKLNGETLVMNGPELPSMLPKYHQGAITVPGLSLGFAVFPFAEVQLCQEYHSRKP